MNTASYSELFVLANYKNRVRHDSVRSSLVLDCFTGLELTSSKPCLSRVVSGVLLNFRGSRLAASPGGRPGDSPRREDVHMPSSLFCFVGGGCPVVL